MSQSKPVVSPEAALLAHEVDEKRRRAQFQCYLKLRELLEKNGHSVMAMSLPDLSIPMLCIAGMQSHSKTSVVEAFLQFPVGYSSHDTATRCPVQYSIRFNAQCKEIRVTINGNVVANQSVPNIIRNHMEALAATDQFNAEPLRVVCEWAQYEDIELIDLPGFVPNSPDAEKIQQVLEIAELYVRNPNYKIILVSKANEDTKAMSGHANVRKLCEEKESKCGLPPRKHWNDPSECINVGSYFEEFMNNSNSAQDAKEKLKGKPKGMVFTSLKYTSRQPNYDEKSATFQQKLERVTEIPKQEAQAIEQWRRRLCQGSSLRTNTPLSQLLGSYANMIGIDVVKARIRKAWFNAFEKSLPKIRHELSQYKKQLQKQVLVAKRRVASCRPRTLRKHYSAFARDFRKYVKHYYAYFEPYIADEFSISRVGMSFAEEVEEAEKFHLAKNQGGNTDTTSEEEDSDGQKEIQKNTKIGADVDAKQQRVATVKDAELDDAQDWVLASDDEGNGNENGSASSGAWVAFQPVEDVFDILEAQNTARSVELIRRLSMRLVGGRQMSRLMSAFQLFALLYKHPPIRDEEIESAMSHLGGAISTNQNIEAAARVLTRMLVTRTLKNGVKWLAGMFEFLAVQWMENIFEVLLLKKYAHIEDHSKFFDNIRHAYHGKIVELCKHAVSIFNERLESTTSYSVHDISSRIFKLHKAIPRVIKGEGIFSAAEEHDEQASEDEQVPVNDNSGSVDDVGAESDRNNEDEKDAAQPVHRARNVRRVPPRGMFRRARDRFHASIESIGISDGADILGFLFPAASYMMSKRDVSDPTKMYENVRKVVAEFYVANLGQLLLEAENIFNHNICILIQESLGTTIESAVHKFGNRTDEELVQLANLDQGAMKHEFAELVKQKAVADNAAEQLIQCLDDIKAAYTHPNDLSNTPLTAKLSNLHSHLSGLSLHKTPEAASSVLASATTSARTATLSANAARSSVVDELNVSAISDEKSVPLEDATNANRAASRDTSSRQKRDEAEGGDSSGEDSKYDDTYHRHSASERQRGHEFDRFARERERERERERNFSHRTRSARADGAHRAKNSKHRGYDSQDD